MMLETEGYQVITASNGEEALRVASSQIPDLVLLDVVMPGPSGFEVSKALKGQHKTKHIPIVMFTTLGRDVDRKMSAEAGANGHFTKPFTHEGLAEMVRRHLETSRRTKFSGALGLSHDELQGRKILLEIDPSSPYERCVRDYCLEARSHGEAVTILTPRASALHRALEGEEGIDLVPWKPNLILSAILEEHEDEPMSLVYSGLTDLVLSKGFEAAYGFARETLNRLDEPRITALLLLNPEAHEKREIASIQNLFSDHVSYGKEGLKKIRFL